MNYLKANWTAPENVYALTTTRIGGISKAPYHENNLAAHVGDIENDVSHNRRMLIETLNLPAEPNWLEQTHSTRCVLVDDDQNRDADAAITRQPNTVLAILTADCLPIVISNTQGTEIAAIHAGWRGLAHGIIDTTVEKMRSPRKELIAWIGPSICQQCYETGAEVRTTFLNHYPFIQNAFLDQGDRLYAHLPRVAEQVLNHLQINTVFQSNQCSYEEKDIETGEYHYYSYRRENPTGRIATLIWFN